MTLHYYRPESKDYLKHVERIAPVPRGESVKRSLARTDTTYFAVNQLGLKPYTWQSKFWDKMMLGNNIMVCSARQVGKTCAIAVFALQACIYNTMPLATTKRTRVVVVSKSIDQSRKIIADVKEWMRVGDDRVRELTKGKIENFFTNQINKSQDASNTKAVITFANGCEIISLPPTESARGYTGSILFLDEAAFFPDEEIFESTLRPIVSQTGNRICMTSTPNGQQGFFYKHFDPNDDKEKHEFERLWVPYTSLYLDDPQIVATRDAMRETAQALGNERSFEQEHMASFNATAASFFDNEDIDSAVVKDKQMLSSYNKPCDMGVDFGGKYSRTVITISALEGTQKKGVIRLLYQYEYQPEKDLTLINDIKSLMKEFQIQRIVFEDCPAADTFRQMGEKAGLPIHMFNPSRDKLRKYFAFRHWLKKGKVELLNIPDLLKQMKGLLQEETPTRTKIHHGAGLLDDRIDSLMMSTIFFTEEAPSFQMIDWDDY